MKSLNKIAEGLLAGKILWLTSLLLIPGRVFAMNEVPYPYTYPEPAWSPYLVGTLIGFVLLATLSIAGKKIGASSAYAAVAGIVGQKVAPQLTESLPYYQENKPGIGWTLTVVVGVILGAFIAAWSGGELTGTHLQDLWVLRFGDDSHLLRSFTALIGGALMAFGARLAGGCTSGHGISGTAQLAVGSWIAVICLFLSGIVTALLLYRL